MLSPELLRRIKTIELRTRRLVQGAFAGAYHSVYKGKGITFSSVRPYAHGDDVRTIDWKVTARTGEPFVKEFVEERELQVMIVLDGSASVLFGTKDRQKRDFAAELGAILAYCATNNNDRASLLIFSDRVEHFVPPRKGRNHIMRVIRDILTFEPVGKGTDLRLALQTVQRVTPAGSIIFLISDFLTPPDAYFLQLASLTKKHHVIALVVRDSLESSFPSVGLIGLQDAETAEIQWVDTQSKKWQDQFQAQQMAFQTTRDKLFSQAGVQQIPITDQDPVYAISLFFKQQLGHRRQ